MGSNDMQCIAKLSKGKNGLAHHQLTGQIGAAAGSDNAIGVACISPLGAYWEVGVVWGLMFRSGYLFSWWTVAENHCWLWEADACNRFPCIARASHWSRNGTIRSQGGYDAGNGLPSLMHIPIQFTAKE